MLSVSVLIVISSGFLKYFSNCTVLSLSRLSTEDVGLHFIVGVRSPLGVSSPVKSINI